MGDPATPLFNAYQGGIFNYTKIGMRTTMNIGVRAHDYGKHTPKELAKILKEAGFVTTQLAIPKAIAGIEGFSEINKGVLEQIKICFETEKVALGVLGCYIEPVLLDKDKRRQELETFFKVLEYNKILGAKLVGTETTYYRGKVTEREKAFNILLDSVLRMVEKAEKVDSFIGIEPVAEHTLNSPELTYKLINKVKSHRLKIIFDPVNLLKIEMLDRQESVWQECFEAFGEQIGAVHLKDVHLKGEAFEPTILGQGCISYDPIFEWLVKNKPCIDVLREEASPLTADQDITFIQTKIRQYFVDDTLKGTSH